MITPNDGGMNRDTNLVGNGSEPERLPTIGRPGRGPPVRSRDWPPVLVDVEGRDWITDERSVAVAVVLTGHEDGGRSKAFVVEVLEPQVIDHTVFIP